MDGHVALLRTGTGSHGLCARAIPAGVPGTCTGEGRVSLKRRTPSSLRRSLRVSRDSKFRARVVCDLRTHFLLVDPILCRVRLRAHRDSELVLSESDAGDAKI